MQIRTAQFKRRGSTYRKANKLRSSSGLRVLGVHSSSSFKDVVDSVTLYRYVFKSRPTGLVSFLLLLTLLIQPFHQAYAEGNTDVQTTKETEQIVVAPEENDDDSMLDDDKTSEVKDENEKSNTENLISTQDEYAITNETNLDEYRGVDEEGIENLSDETSQIEDTNKGIETTGDANGVNVNNTDEADDTIEVEQNSSSTTDSYITEEEFNETTDLNNGELEEENSETVFDVATSTDSVASSTTNQISSTSVEVESDKSFTDTSSNSNEETVVSDETSSSTMIEAISESEKQTDNATSTEAVITVSSDTAFTFTKDECTRVDDGTFYCHKQPKVEADLGDKLTALPDSDGDLEIYLLKEGERIKITDNKVDDASPFFDNVSNTIVWHRLINDRYQIISYDIDTGSEVQLTNNTVNNMEPTRLGNYTAWQRWVVDNWEIILHDGVGITQISNSKGHDVAPNIRGNFVIWNSESDNKEKELTIYDIETGDLTSISDTDGVSVTNPRMIMMYEAVYDNGDVVTKGFDLITGEIVPLHALPRDLPDEIPEADTTGETRALIQTKPDIRQTVSSDGNSDDEPDNFTNTSSQATSTIDLRQPIEQTDSSTTTPDHIPDLDLRHMSMEFASKTEPVIDVEDVVIEPYNAISTSSATSSKQSS